MNSLKNNAHESLKIALRLYEYYPNRIAKYAVEKEGKWSAGVFAIKEYGCTEVIFCYDKYKFRSEEAAMEALNYFVETQIKLIKTMSN